MKFTRIMGELGLASGAIAGILFIAAPPLPSISAQLPLSVTSSQPANVENELGLDKLLGIAQFVKNPTQYHVMCDDGLAQITAASLTGDRMTIDYSYPAVGSVKTGAVRTGQLIGTVNSDGIFSGTHSVEPNSLDSNSGQSKSVDSQSAAPQGEVTFTFSVDGTAEGKRIEGVGTTGIALSRENNHDN